VTSGNHGGRTTNPERSTAPGGGTFVNDTEEDLRVRILSDDCGPSAEKWTNAPTRLSPFRPLEESEFRVAREVFEKLVDDLDGRDAAETVRFGLDGGSCEIDLSKRNAAALRKALGPYISAARRSSNRSAGSRRRSTSSPSSTKSSRNDDIAQLREWAGANGLAIPSRGRIPQAVVAQYKPPAVRSRPCRPLMPYVARPVRDRLDRSSERTVPRVTLDTIAGIAQARR
jgi:hypothetical protein